MKHQDVVAGKDLFNNRGAVAVYTAIVLVVLLAFGALAVDVGHLYGVRNELNNAADAGALAGAQSLYDDDGNLTVENAKDEAKRVAELNPTGNVKVSIQDGGVQVGHWSFITRTFTPSDKTTQLDGWQEMGSIDLDTNTEFINAVRVTVNRPDTPSFLAQILSFFSDENKFKQFMVGSRGTAYLGFAGFIPPGEVDWPLGLCQNFLKQGGHYSCSVGRLISDNDETGGWTNFDQTVLDGECTPTNPPTVNSLPCSKSNSNPIFLGEYISATDGMVQPIFDNLYEKCWLKNNAPPDHPLNVTLPVVDCGLKNFRGGQCKEMKVVGVVNVDIVWMQNDNPQSGNDPVPRKMWNEKKGEWWTCPTGSAQYCFNELSKEFDLKDKNGDPAKLEKKSIYFLPNCKVHKPIGNTGGENYGIIARVPYLVD